MNIDKVHRTLAIAARESCIYHATRVKKPITEFLQYLKRKVACMVGGTCLMVDKLLYHKETRSILALR